MENNFSSPERWESPTCDKDQLVVCHCRTMGKCVQLEVVQFGSTISEAIWQDECCSYPKTLFRLCPWHDDETCKLGLLYGMLRWRSRFNILGCKDLNLVLTKNVRSSASIRAEEFTVEILKTQGMESILQNVWVKGILSSSPGFPRN